MKLAEFEKVQVSLSGGQWRDCIEGINAVLDAIYESRALCFLQGCQFRQCIAQCEAILRRDQGNGKALIRKAHALFSLGDDEAVVEKYAKAAQEKLGPLDPEVCRVFALLSGAPPSTITLQARGRSGQQQADVSPTVVRGFVGSPSHSAQSTPQGSPKLSTRLKITVDTLCGDAVNAKADADVIDGRLADVVVTGKKSSWSGDPLDPSLRYHVLEELPPIPRQVPDPRLGMKRWQQYYRLGESFSFFGESVSQGFLVYEYNSRKLPLQYGN